MNSVPDAGGLTQRISEIRKDYYENLVSDNPKNAVFLKGWLNRVDNCMKVDIKCVARLWFTVKRNTILMV